MSTTIIPADVAPITDPHCERAVIATLTANPDDFFAVRDLLSPELFTEPDLRAIYNATAAIYAQGHSADLTTIAARLKTDGSTLTFTDLVRLSIDFRPITDIGSHVLLLRDLAGRRRLWSAAQNLVKAASSPIDDPYAAASRACKEITEAFGENNRSVTTLTDTYPKLQKQMLLNRDLANADRCYGTPTGFPQLDRRGGLTPPALVIVGAQTSQGKTSFALALTLSAIKAGHPVAFFSLEMTDIELSARLSAMLSGIPSSDILYRSLDITRIRRIDEGVATVDGNLLLFDDRSTSSIENIISSIRRLHARHGIKGAVVDYLQLVTMAGATRKSREEITGEIARMLKNLAKELDIWIIAISQLARDRQNPLPSMSRLRNSGQIEEAADIVILIYRPEDGLRFPAPFENTPTQGHAWIRIGKGRNIGVFDFICRFDPSTTTFSPLDTDAVPIDTLLQPSPHSGPGHSTPASTTPADDLEEELPF